MTVPFALSIHHFINSVGSDAGFASIIGLAILVLLYFAQMRETATLRDQAAESAERQRQLEGRLTQVLRAQAAAVPAPLAQGQPQPAQALRQGATPARALGGVPAPATAAPATAAPAGPAVPRPPRIAPAGVGAPALTAATKLIPTDEPAGGVAVAPAPAAPVPFDVGPTPAPATAAGAGNGSSVPRTPVPVAPPPGPAVPPRVQIRPGATVPPTGRRPAGPGFTSPDEPHRSIGRTVAYGIGGVIVVAAIVVGLLALTGGGSSNPKTSPARTTNAPTTARHRRRTHTATVIPSNVTVAVLNGTATANLAKDISGRLTAIGFKPGAVTNAPDQTHSTTIVQYLPGNPNRLGALAVAQKLGVPTSAVQPIDSSTQTVACAQPTPCPPTGVVVTVGLDLSGTATGAPASTAPASTSVATSTSAVGTTTGTGTTP